MYFFYNTTRPPRHTPAKDRPQVQLCKRHRPGARHIGHFGFFRPQFAESLWAGYLLPELGSGNALSRG